MNLLGKLSAVLVLLLTAATTMAQSSSIIDERFAALDQSLTETANHLLAAAAAPPASVPEKVTSQTTAPRKSASAPVGAQSRRWRELQKQIEPILKQQDLPVEILAVVKIESGGQLDALSPAGARGLWQLMPDTARRYGLIVSETKDERLNLEKATWAATQYLRDLHELFGDWRLVLAAYNAGEQAVSRAMVRHGSREFDVLSQKRAIPEETRRYVPAVLAEMRRMGDSSMPAILNHGGQRRESLVYASMGWGD